MLIAVFLKEFAMIEGDAKVKTKGGEIDTIEYITTRRDMTHGGSMMEAPMYRVSEELLRKWGNSSGKVRFLLSATQAKGHEVEVEVAASRFSDIDAYIAETKNVLGVLFEN